MKKLITFFLFYCLEVTVIKKNSIFSPLNLKKLVNNDFAFIVKFLIEIFLNIVKR